ncbi:hypothetical protein [Timonella sp. A28]|uniref:hypothetical protein n=1 Tax=Timonella sp. A28 TaxID=3442640 RepID=UPI003EB75ABA
MTALTLKAYANPASGNTMGIIIEPVHKNETANIRMDWSRKIPVANIPIPPDIAHE